MKTSNHYNTGKTEAASFRPVLHGMMALSLMLGCLGCSEPEPDATPAPAPSIAPDITALDAVSVVAPPPGAHLSVEPEAPAEQTGTTKYAPLNAEALAALNEAVALYGTDEEGRKVKIPKDVEQLVQEKFLMFMPVPPKGSKLIVNQKTGLLELVAAR
ncbi:MAG TPA: hypothetical protein VGH19_23745 [Verrucomicrobiae bacterium]